MKVKNCECCYMPMAKDPKDSGSNKYCSYCYFDGKLKADGMNLAQFKRQAYEGMKKLGMNSLKAWFFFSSSASHHIGRIGRLKVLVSRF